MAEGKNPKIPRPARRRTRAVRVGGSLTVPAAGKGVAEANDSDAGPGSPPAESAATGGIPRRIKAGQLRQRGGRRPPPRKPASSLEPGPQPQRKQARRSRKFHVGTGIAVLTVFAAGALTATALDGDESEGAGSRGPGLKNATPLAPTGQALEGASARATLTGKAFSRLTVNVEVNVPRDFTVALVSDRSRRTPVFLSLQRRGKTTLRQPLNWRTLPRYERLAIFTQEPRGTGAKKRMIPREVLRVSVDTLMRESDFEPQ